MSGKLLSLVKPEIQIPLDDNFRPAVLWNRTFLNIARNTGESVPLSIGIEKEDSSVLVYKTHVFPDEHGFASYNYQYVERLVKALLWIYGGYKIIIGGSKKIGEYIKKLYFAKGKRAFDSNFMSGIYEKPFAVEISDTGKIFPTREKSIPLGGHLDGCRIGFDLGASDRKVSAVIDGKVVFSEEVVWDPAKQIDPCYHYHEILSMLHRAAAHMPHVQAIGGSSAGIYINKRGNINDWLNELAFVPVDLNSEAPIDEWSADRGCGVQYLSQLAAIRLAKRAGIVLDGKQTLADKLKYIQELMARGDKRVEKVFETIGCYLGYSIAYYAQFYEIEIVLILGRVTSGEGGQIILKKASQVLEEEFPELAGKITLHLPDESSRRVGQSIAAASAPLISN